MLFFGGAFCLEQCLDHWERFQEMKAKASQVVITTNKESVTAERDT